jgi:predicted ATP-grasp superfamily ATP-dependent carboligase
LRHPCCRTRSCERIVAAADAAAALERLAGELPGRPVLYPCTDLAVLSISRNRASLERRYHILLPKPSVVETLMDKTAFYRFARSHSFAVPATFLLRNARDVEDAAGQLNFPAMLKPPIKTAAWQAEFKEKAFRVENATELRHLYVRCAPFAEHLLVQDLVAGDVTSNFTCNAYFNAHSRALVAFVTRKLRQWPPETGTGCLGEECRNDLVLQETLRFFEAAHHRGFGYLEMKQDARTGEYFIIEPNIGRPTGRSATAEAAGVDFLYTQYCDAVGLPLPERREQPYKGTKWIYLRRDCQAALRQMRHGKLGPLEWLRSVWGTKAEALFSLRDPVPFLADFARSFGKLTGERSSDAARPAAPAPRPAGRTRMNIDFDIHGLAGIRLLDATLEDLAAVRRQLGPMEGPLRAAPDIVVRFVDELPAKALVQVEAGNTGYDEDGFYLLRSRKRPARVRIDMRQIGGPVEIVCRRGLRAVPLLLAILNLTLLKKNCVALHASAFVHEGVGVLVTGWAKGGKTEALLSFARHGARCVGDEWVLLAQEGRKAYGIPERIRLQDWHIAQLPHVRAQLSRADRLFFAAIHAFERTVRLLPLGRLREAVPALRRQLNAQFDPRAVFGDNFGPHVMTPEKIFLMVSHERPEIEVAPADPNEIAERMVESLRYERLPFFSTYLAHSFAFPARRNEFVERAHTIERSLLRSALAGKEAYVVRHPYPCSFDALFESMKPYCRSTPAIKVKEEGHGFHGLQAS